MSTPVSTPTRRSVLRGLAGVGAAAGLSALVGAEQAAATEISTTWRPSGTSPTRVTGSRAGTGTVSRPRAQTGTPAPTTAPSGPAPAVDGNAASLLSTDPALHAARRLTYGPTPELVAEIRRLGVSAWIEQQLAPATIDDSTCDGYLRRFPLLSKTPPELQATIGWGSYDAMDQVMRATTVRAIWSKRQLFEVMVDFWSNHFNTTARTPEMWDLKSSEDRDVIRRHALGRFADMLKADATHPAMLRYLNQAESSKTSPNENYARELLELHTVGVTGGDTETDVKNAARLLTGMTITNDGRYTYRPDWHYVGPVRIMDFSHANGDAMAGQSVIAACLDYLARHPSTARFLATKLARRFVTDHPSEALISHLADVYLRNDTAIAPVLRALFSSAEFAASSGVKERRPFEDIVATVRVLGISLKQGDTGTADLQDLVFAVLVMGHGPHCWPSPNGYPDVATAWASPSAQLARWNCHMRLVLGWWNRDFVNVGLPALVGNPSSSTPAGQLVDRLCDRLLFQRMRPEHRSALLGFMGLGETAPAGNHVTSDGLSMLAAIILDSPYWGQR